MGVGGFEPTTPQHQGHGGPVPSQEGSCSDPMSDSACAASHQTHCLCCCCKVCRWCLPAQSWTSQRIELIQRAHQGCYMHCFETRSGVSLCCCRCCFCVGVLLVFACTKWDMLKTRQTHKAWECWPMAASHPTDPALLLCRCTAGVRLHQSRGPAVAVFWL